MADETPPPEPPEPLTPPGPSEPAVPHNLADWGTRALGFLIDYAPILIIQIIFFRSSFILSVGGIAGILYWVLMGYLDGESGQSPGKAIMGTRVVDANGNLLGGGVGIGRKFVHVLDVIVCMLGWLLPLVDSRRQTIADKVMNTYVVAGLEKKNLSFDLWLPPGRQASGD